MSSGRFTGMLPPNGIAMSAIRMDGESHDGRRSPFPRPLIAFDLHPARSSVSPSQTVRGAAVLRFFGLLYGLVAYLTSSAPFCTPSAL